jgi:hypothetical protein
VAVDCYGSFKELFLSLRFPDAMEPSREFGRASRIVQVTAETRLSNIDSRMLVATHHMTSPVSVKHPLFDACSEYIPSILMNVANTFCLMK